MRNFNSQLLDFDATKFALVRTLNNDTATFNRPTFKMTFYNNIVIQLTDQLHSKDYLTRNAIKAKHFMDENFLNDIDIDKIANQAHQSKFHSIRQFKNIYGRTPYQYLPEVRIAKAKKLLLGGQAVSEVCMSVGFDSVTSFTRLFKKITGTTPALFRKEKAILNKSNNYTSDNFATN